MVAVDSSTRLTWTSVTFHDAPASRQTRMSCAGSVRARLPTDFHAPTSLSVIARQNSGTGPRSIIGAPL